MGSLKKRRILQKNKLIGNVIILPFSHKGTGEDNNILNSSTDIYMLTSNSINP